jgi:hypothetical protein
MARPFQFGEPLSARKLNAHSAALAQSGLTGAPGSSMQVGSTTAMLVHDLVNTGLICRVTEDYPEPNTNDKGTARIVHRYSWEAIRLDEFTENWAIDPSRFGHNQVDPIYAMNFGELAITEDDAFNTNIDAEDRPKVTPYVVMKDPVSQKLFAQPAGSGEIQTKGQDIVLMILGDYATYKDCPGVYNVVGDPPKVNNLLCEPAYAWSAYKVCGYKFKKLFTMKDYKKWAIELNGGVASGIRRFYPAIFGWDSYKDAPAQQNVSAACAGVRFLGYSSQGSLLCECPEWLSDVSCLRVEVKFVPQVTCNTSNPPAGCACDDVFWTKMASLWGTTQTITMCGGGINGCIWNGTILDSNGGSFINFFFSWQNYPPDADKDGNCSWGPDEFDPCYPCDGFSRMGMSVNIAKSGGGGGGNYFSWYKTTINAIRTLVQSCPNGTPVQLEFGGLAPTAGCPNPIESIKISCCNQNEINNCVSEINP